jgi:hypothetical protein
VRFSSPSARDRTCRQPKAAAAKYSQVHYCTARYSLVHIKYLLLHWSAFYGIFNRESGNHLGVFVLDMKKAAPRPRNNRSGLTNNIFRLPGVDMRSPRGRRYRDLCDALIAEFGDADPAGLRELATNKRPVVLCLAPTAKQAGVVYGYICAIFESSPLLAKLVTNKTAEILSLTNGI